MRTARLLTLAVIAAGVASAASAGPIVSGNGESWSTTLDAVCSQVGSCSGTTVVTNAHPSWADASLTTPLAQWVSYADTGYGGTVLAPAAGSSANPTGQTAIMDIFESFKGLAGSAVSVRFWADDTLAVYFNGDLMKAPVFSQSTCADAPIGCESGEFWDLNTVATGGNDVIRMVAYQVGNGSDTSSNPFGVLYSGSYVNGSVDTQASVPEPVTLALLGIGLLGVSAKRFRR